MQTSWLAIHSLKSIAEGSHSLSNFSLCKISDQSSQRLGREEQLAQSEVWNFDD